MDTHDTTGAHQLTSKGERGRQTKISVRWPVTIISGQETLEAESRDITVKGIFLQSQKELKGDEIYQLIVRGPHKKTVLIKGKMVWSNMDEKRRSRSLPGGAFFFVKAAKEDREILRSFISDHLKP
jgi:hypothetical protein